MLLLLSFWRSRHDIEKKGVEELEGMLLMEIFGILLEYSINKIKKDL